MSDTNAIIDLAPIDATTTTKNANRSILKELHDNDINMHSPLNTKASSDTAVAAANKSNTMSSSVTACPRLTMSNIKESIIQQQTTSAAAGTAKFEPNSTFNEFDKSTEFQTDPLHKVDVSKRFSNRFLGLTEFDEADIPDLPDNSSAEIGEEEDPLKLTFNDGTVSNSCMNLTNSFNSSTYKKGNLLSDLTHLQLPNNDPDTAVSSDNETYAECLSYRESELNFEFPMEISDAEHYRSALNSHNNTTNNIDTLNTTMENEIGKQIMNADNLITEKSNPIMQYSECEPMDIDMNSTLEISNNSNNSTLEVNHTFEKEQVEDKEPSVEKITENGAQTQKINEAKSVESSKIVETVLKEETCEKCIESEQKSFSNAAEIKESISITNAENYKVTDDTTQNATQNKDENKNPTLNPEKGQVIATPIPESLPQKGSTSHTESKLSLIIDSVVSAKQICPKQSGQISPSFPIKPVFEKSKFPASPTALKNGPPSFLEKSEYTEHSSTHNDKLLDQISVQVICTNPDLEKNNAAGDSNIENPINDVVAVENLYSPGIAVQDNVTNQTSPAVNTTISISDQISPLSINNATFDGSSTSTSPNQIASDTFAVETIDEKRRTFNVNALTAEIPYPPKLDNKRLTYNCDSHLPPENVQSEELNKSDDKRRTFNVINPEPAIEKICCSDAPQSNQLFQSLNVTCEAMDVDDSFSVQLPNTSSNSPKQLEQTTSFSSSLHDTRTSPISMMLNRPTICSIATAAAAQILSQSPPLPSLKQSIPNEKNSLKMPPPVSPRQNKKYSSNDPDAAHLADMLSAKEQTKSNSKDEKDIFVEKFTPSPVEEIFASNSVINPFSSSNMTGQIFGAEQFKTGLTDADFSNSNNIILQPSDFDFLLTKGSNNAPVDRSSLLLRFDPLLGVPVPVNKSQQQQQALQQILQKTATGTRATTATIVEEGQVEVHGDSNCVKSKGSETTLVPKQQQPQEQQQQQKQLKPDLELSASKKHANMSVDVIKDINIDNDCTKSKENLNTQSDEKQANFKMDELEKKIKNEVLKTEDIEKKLKEAEQREEASIKRITEKDKTISKLNGVIEAYEKAIAELIAEKEQLVHNYEKQLTEIKADRDSNYHHLMSLESTFSDLHVKYEKSKDMTLQLKANEEALLSEKRQNLENLRMQEQRYEKMKNHAMQQLEIANKTLESMKKEHAVETTKLKALLKKEEISRASTNEQLQQKMRENEELVKICDELINGQGS